MQWDLVLLAKVVRGKNRGAAYRALRNLGVGEHLITPIYRPVWQWIRQHDLDDRGLPTETMLRAKFPGITFPDTDAFKGVVEQDSSEEIVARLRERNLTLIAQEAGTKLVELSETNPREIPKLMEQAQRDILGTLPIPGIIEAGSTLEEDMLEYEQFSKPGGAGLRFPYESIVPGGMGLNPGGAYWIYGPPGQKKTWFLVWLCLWYLAKFPHHRALVLSQEMAWDRLKWRFYAMRGGFSWTDVQNGQVNQDEMRRVVASFRAQRNLYVQGPISGPDARPVVESLVSTFQPDYVFDDSSYLRVLTSGKDVNIVRNSPVLGSEWSGFVKNLAARYGVPYFMTWQPNDEGQLYNSRAGMQDAEAVFYLESSGDGRTTTIGVKKNRDGTPVQNIYARSDLNDMGSFGTPTDDLETLGRCSLGLRVKPRIVLSTTPEA